MKKAISVLLICMMCLSCLGTAIGVSAEADNTAPIEKIVYLSDNGSDDNDGLTAEKAVKSFAAAQTVLGDEGGVIMIVDRYTQNAWGLGGTAFPNATYILRGAKADGTAEFVHARSIGMNVPLTFDNLTYVNGTNAWAASTLYAQCHRLEFTETVKSTLQNDDSRYAVIYAGTAAAGTGDAELVINGGQFHYVYGGAKGALTGSVSLTIGGNAVIQQVYAGGTGNVTNGLTVAINGGSVVKGIYLAGDSGTVSGDTNVTVTGGTFAKLSCGSDKENVTNAGKITVDVSGCAAAKEENWVSTYITDQTANTTVVTEPPEKCVYLSDNGNDDNSGLTADKAVLTFAKAQEVLGEGGGLILIPDVYTYASTFNYYMNYKAGASYTIRGVKEDGSSKFVHGRKNIAMNNPLTFDNLTYEITASTWSGLYAFYNRLEFTDSVVVTPYQGVDERVNYLFVYGGSDSKVSKQTNTAELVLNGGTFGYVVGAAKNAEHYGNVSITFGGNAKIIQRLYCGGESGINDVYGTTNVTITGGTIGENIFLGGVGATTFVSGDTNLTVTGGTFAAIYCRSSGGGEHLGNITIDVTGYAPAQEDTAWGATYVKDATAKTTLLGATLPTPEPEPGESDTNETDTNAPDTNAPGTNAPETNAPETNAPETNAPETNAPETDAATTDAPAEENLFGCASAVSVSCLSLIALIGLGAAAVAGKKED